MPMVLVSVLVSSLVGCGSPSERIVVLAASSLTESFTDLEHRFEADHPGVDVVVSFGGSSTLAGQLAQGVAADVFAAADLPTMDRVRSDLTDAPIVFARNRLVIAVRSGNPADVAGLADLARDDVVVVLAAPEVPAGRYAAAIVEASGVEIRPASLEQNVRAAAAKVALGEADAAIVYLTDVTARPGDLDAIELDTIDLGSDVVADYPIAAVTEVGREFVEFVTGSIGRETMAAHGFELP